MELKNATLIATTNNSEASDEAATTTLGRRLQHLESKELVIALSGPLAANIEWTEEELEKILSGCGYDVHRISLSDIIIETLSANGNKILSLFNNSTSKNISLPLPERDEYERIKSLQDMGNFLRKEFDPGILTQKAIDRIIYYRLKKSEEEFNDYNKKNGLTFKSSEEHEAALIEFASEDYKPNKTAYLIRQLKNPAEVELLRAVYGDLFFLIGVLDNKERRVKNLANKLKPIHKHDSESKALELECRDKAQDEKYEQQLEKTLKLSDYFIHSPNSSRDDISDQVERFINLGRV